MADEPEIVEEIAVDPHTTDHDHADLLAASLHIDARIASEAPQFIPAPATPVPGKNEGAWQAPKPSEKPAK